MYRLTVTAIELIFVWMAKIICVPVRMGTETKNHGSTAVRPPTIFSPTFHIFFLVPPTQIKDVSRVSLKKKTSLFKSYVYSRWDDNMRESWGERLSSNPTSHTFFFLTWYASLVRLFQPGPDCASWLHNRDYKRLRTGAKVPFSSSEFEKRTNENREVAKRK